MYEWQDENAVKAREATAEEYLNRIKKDGWQVTHTENRVEKWDCTVTNGFFTYYVETKLRDIPSEKVKQEGAMIDCEKVNTLVEKGNGLVVQFFWKSDEVYIWDVRERGSWKIGNRLLNHDSFSDKKIYKCVYYMPMDDRHLKKLDMSDYLAIYNKYYKQSKENEYTA